MNVVSVLGIFFVIVFGIYKMMSKFKEGGLSSAGFNFIVWYKVALIFDSEFYDWLKCFIKYIYVFILYMLLMSRGLFYL